MSTPRVATGNTFNSEPTALEWAVLKNCFFAVLGTGWGISAASAEQW